MGTAVATISSGLLGQGLLIVTSVLAARLLGPEDRGYLALAALGPTALATVGTLGVPVGVTYYLVRSSDVEVRRRYHAAAVRLAALLAVGLTVVYALALLLAGPLLPSDGRVALWLGFGAVAPLVAITILGAVAQAVPGLRLFNVVRVLPILGYTLLLVALALLGDATLEAVTIVWVAANVLAAAVAVVTLVRPQAQIQVTAREVRDIVRFGLASYLGALGSADVQRLLEQAIVAVMLSAADLGLWVVATSLTLALSLPARNIRLIAFPDIARTTAPAEARRKVRRYAFVTAVAVGVLALALGMGAPVLIAWVYGSEFEPAADSARWLLAATWLLAVRRSYGDSLRALGRARPGSAAEGVHLVLFAFACPMLIAQWGIEGAAFAVLFAAGASLTVQAFSTRRGLSRDEGSRGE